MKMLLSLILYMALSFQAAAIGVDKDILADPDQEARAQMIMQQLRCLVCQNQSIVESDAELAADLRQIVREKIRAGATDQQIMDFMTSRYGDWVLLKPPFRGKSMLVWIGPLLILLAGGTLVMVTLRRQQKNAAPKPLSEAEARRLKKLMGDDGK